MHSLACRRISINQALREMGLGAKGFSAFLNPSTQSPFPFFRKICHTGLNLRAEISGKHILELEIPDT